MGHDSAVFFRKVLPALVGCGVVEETAYKGSGKQKRYRLGVSLLAVQQSIAHANGSFDEFLSQLGN